jgi:hypothetical protein
MSEESPPYGFVWSHTETVDNKSCKEIYDNKQDDDGNWEGLYLCAFKGK